MRTALSLMLSMACVLPAQAGLKIYYLRHGETGANAEYEWRDKGVPRDQWPSYVGNAGVFSPRGEEQVKAVPDKLKNHTFDFIAVSPLWRARNTILPHLRATNQKGEIWPELAEAEDDFKALMEHVNESDKLPPPSPDILTGGEPIVLPDDEKEFFTLRPGGEKLEKLGHGSLQKAADRKALLDHTIGLIRERFGGSDKTILIVGHGNAGRLLAHALTGDKHVLDDGVYIYNTCLWMAEEQPDGTFKLEMYNDKPWGR